MSANVYVLKQEQYVFVYDSLLEALICGDTTVSSHAFPEVYNDLCLYDADIGKTKLEEQFEVSWVFLNLQKPVFVLYWHEFRFPWGLPWLVFV